MKEKIFRVGVKGIIIGLVLGCMEFDVTLKHPVGDALLSFGKKQICTRIYIWGSCESVIKDLYQQGLPEIVRRDV